MYILSTITSSFSFCFIGEFGPTQWFYYKYFNLHFICLIYTCYGVYLGFYANSFFLFNIQPMILPCSYRVFHMSSTPHSSLSVMYDIIVHKIFHNSSSRLLWSHVAPRFSPSLPLLKQLRWLPIVYQIKLKLATVTYRTLSSQQLTQLVNLLHFSDISRTLKSSISKQVFVPKTKLNIGKNAFSVAVQTIWNQLPIAIKSPEIHLS